MPYALPVLRSPARRDVGECSLRYGLIDDGINWCSRSEFETVRSAQIGGLQLAAYLFSFLESKTDSRSNELAP
jgi:hypothetical protein